MVNKPKVSKGVYNKDVVLCETTNRGVSMRCAKTLMAGSVPFTSCWSTIPFYKRWAYNGAKQLCTISINRGEYSKARRAIDELEERDYRRLMLNLI
ncbi:MAG: hypothetical protein HUJ71_05455 [Pseudobutyrivibrio sp.]|nr:hypothetical protein [Pseudobutyrivibrio sp.]